MKNIEARKKLNITQTHFSYIKKAANVPKGHNFDYTIIEKFLKCNPEAKRTFSVARDMALGKQPISYTEYLGKIKTGKNITTPDRVAWSTRMDAHCFVALKRAREATRISTSKIVELLITGHLDDFVELNKIDSPEYEIQRCKAEIEEAENFILEQKSRLSDLARLQLQDNLDLKTKRIA